MPAPPPRTWTNVVRAFLRNRLASVALALLLIIIVACFAAQVFFPEGPNVGELSDSLVGPSAAHWLGTDQLGRDLLARVLYGGQATLLYALLVTVVAVCVAVPLGMIAGYAGRAVDRTVMFIVDIGLAIPAMIVMLVVMSLFQGYTWAAMLILGLLLAPPIVRNIRGPAMAVRHELFIDAAQLAGLSSGRIITKHVLPRIMGPVLVQAALAAAIALQFAVGLSFLGFGNDPSTPDWGKIIAEGSQVLNKSPWPLLAGGLTLGLTTLALVLVGDGVRDVAVDVWAGAPARKRRGRRRTAATTAVVPRGTAPAAPGAAAATPDADAADEDVLLRVRGLSVSFSVDGEPRQVVSDVDLDVAPGETLAIVGESGCGKTSVARAIARLLPQGGEISAGTVRFGDTDVAHLRGKRLYEYRRNAVSYIAQDPMTALDPSLRVGVLLRRIVAATDGGSRTQIDRRVRELLEQVQLPDPDSVIRRYPHELSGGMAQRIGIARAIATRPRLLIADEPTTALDVTVQAEILTLLQSIQRTYGMAILLVSHDWGVVTEMCDRAVVMYAGEIVERGGIAEVVNDAAHPYTAALLACRPSQIVDDSLELPTIRGTVAAPGSWPVGCRFAARCDFRTDACDAGPIAIAPGVRGHAARCIHPRVDLRTATQEEGIPAHVN
ncbi:dipeptide/oligopeptide/nickel ABC transporter permease/ATP-binding protein [Microbacterium sp. NPDC091313]